MFEYDFRTTDGRGSHPLIKTALMKVSRVVLMKNSTHFQVMLSGHFKEAASNLIELHEDTICSAELWFRALHGNLVDDSYLIEREEIYNAIAFSRKYFLHIEKLNEYFETYWSRLDKTNLVMDDLQELLYPAYSEAFDHPAAFAYITEKMAHTGSGHIEEHNPSRHRELHVPGRTIRKFASIFSTHPSSNLILTEQLNAAKGSMRREIIKGLFNPLECFCSTNCSVNEKSLKAYIEGIKLTKIWPLETMHTRSNEDIVESPGFVNWKCKIPEGACYSCRSKLEGSHIEKTGDKIRDYWDGLCLDCMDISAPKTGDLNTDYWLHNKLEDWDRNCRISHTRNTWYFSFMGRSEIMSSFNREQQQRKKAARLAARPRRFSDSS
jgi:hypothetical protein